MRACQHYLKGILLIGKEVTFQVNPYLSRVSGVRSAEVENIRVLPLLTPSETPASLFS